MAADNFATALARRPRLAERCFTPAEADYCLSRRFPAQHFAARFAAKEAVGQALGIGLELQADCLAGAWSALANKAGNVTITDRELDQALNAASAVGDDRIQQKTQGRVDPESWTHGSAQQRHDAFLAGYTTSDPARCDALLPLH